MHATLFVYGTLRQGQSNAHRLDGLGEYAGPASMKGTLYRVAEYPGMTDGAGVVQGELFELSDPGASLPELDEFEGTVYERVEREAVRADGSSIAVWVYVYRGPLAGKAVIESGDWVSEIPS